MAPSETAEVWAGGDTGLDASVRQRQVSLLMRSNADVIVSLLNASLVSVTLWPLYPIWAKGLWISLFCGVHLHRRRLRSRFARATPEAKADARWGRSFTASAFATGCLWGLTASVFFVTTDPGYQAFMVFVLGGMTAGAIVVTAADLRPMFAFVGPAAMPAVAILMFRGGLTQTLLGFMLAVFATVLIVTGRSINTSIDRNFRLRISQDILSAKLRISEAAMADAEAIAHVGSWQSNLKDQSLVWSDETCRIFGVDPAGFKPSHQAMLSRVHPEDRPAVERDYAEFAATGKSPGIDHRLMMDDGAIKYVHELRHAEFDEHGAVLRIDGATQDMTESRRLEMKADFSNLVLKTQMEAYPDGILVVDDAGKIILFNKKLADMWHIPLEALEKGDDPVVLRHVVSKIKDAESFKRRVEYLYDHPDEDSCDDITTIDGLLIERYTVALHSRTGGYIGRAWFFRDVTEHRAEIALALRTARADMLTGLANRGVFVEALDHAIARARREGTSFAVVYLDLDHFKDVNDTFGHAVGDELLRAVAGGLRSMAGDTDTIARFSGDEFALLATAATDQTAMAVLAVRLMNALSGPFDIGGRRIHSGASIGIDVYEPAIGAAETMLMHAEVALYRAKAEGRGVYRFFTEAMDTDVRGRVALVAELRSAITTDQLFLVYQPQVEIESGRITGLEALARWRHPGRGVLGPDLFIPVAEQAGLIGGLGHWVLRTACLQAKTWLDAGFAPTRMCVNVSALQFKALLALEADIMAILAETGLPPERLELELTESALMNASRDHSDVLHRLHGAGLTIAIDDFGTGYSSLDYLRRFPVTRIKIAQNFVKHLETNPSDTAIVKATIGLAHELGIEVIAEGVEGPGQYDMLKAWGCAEVQGYYFARPLDVDEITALLRGGGPLQRRANPADRERTLPLSSSPPLNGAVSGGPGWDGAVRS